MTQRTAWRGGRAPSERCLSHANQSSRQCSVPGPITAKNSCLTMERGGEERHHRDEESPERSVAVTYVGRVVPLVMAAGNNEFIYLEYNNAK
ncbi:hypothetical protein J6590_027316 [Homalodisca vitripennis]|nr:hypothetical protein J6590_027316 [Homalodisca vitripennis]